jgi:hypothetical protein
VPYQRIRVRHGCFQIPACSLSKSDIRGSWSVLLDASQSYDWLLSIVESGGQITGTYSYAYDRGVVTGTRSGDAVTFRMRTYACDVTMSGTATSGCLMTGQVTLAGSCYTWDPRTFFARR